VNLIVRKADIAGYVGPCHQGMEKTASRYGL